MTYAITRETAQRGVYLVFCAVCRGDLGTMTMGTIREAIAKKGPVLCMECRKGKCDYCGWLSKNELPTLGGAGKVGLYHICVRCAQRHLNTDPPKHEKTLLWPRINDVTLDETMAKEGRETFKTKC